MTITSASQRVKKAIFKKFFLARGNRNYIKTPATVMALYPLKSNFLLATVVFNDAELIAWQYYSLGKLTDHYDYLVADTSSDEGQAKNIASFCAEKKISYLRLPQARSGLDASLYHGLALNWVFYNIVRKVTPERFGFLDPDIFVISPGSFLVPWEERRFWGTKAGNDVWRLWPGFCFFRRDFYQENNLNFLPSGKLDTGGMNYPFLKDLDTGHLIPVDTIVEKRLAPGAAGNIQFFANVVHLVGGVSLKSSYKEETVKKREFAHAVIFGDSSSAGV